MKKNFWPWHRLKSDLHHRTQNPPYFHEREVWFCSLGLNVGHEQDGIHKQFERPVVILKRFKHSFLAIPLSTQIRNDKYHLHLVVNDINQCAILSQIRLLDARRLLRYLGTISIKDFERLKSAFIKLIQ